MKICTPILHIFTTVVDQVPYFLSYKMKEGCLEFKHEKYTDAYRYTKHFVNVNNMPTVLMSALFQILG
jgi:hypothetical protein